MNGGSIDLADGKADRNVGGNVGGKVGGIAQRGSG